MLSFRRLSAIDMYKFSSDFEESALIRSPLNDDLSLVIDQFNSTLQSMIDNHAPIIRRSVTLRPYAPWSTDEIKVAKSKRRKLERRWHTHNTEANHLLHSIAKTLTPNKLDSRTTRPITFMGNVRTDTQSVIYFSRYSWKIFSHDKTFSSGKVWIALCWVSSFIINACCVSTFLQSSVYTD